ncbi:hydrogenase small subunit [Beggiatoa leptomitoformis]|uniref:hydrogenase (acceptor) n=1 Tax=Beggiatoa leptomitoformis TaxID=288004 RepID=A0A2N9YAJ2_9GAMM|nr:hydrogenase small subunit [Beggiatoa leptomitoformis]ALG67141.1 hydrogenase small subunit [Beggiatoa leptomitoformis]AUI67459.1 hydrogenase small subunit [Beggiatoa leptomitoformis]
MHNKLTIGESLRAQGMSRRSFLQFCTVATGMMGLSASLIPQVARALEKAQRPSVIWLSFQECTGCSESLTRAHSPSVESLIFDYISLDYHHTLQAASGEAAEQARIEAMNAHKGEYLLVVDGSVPLGNMGYSTIAGESNLDILKQVAKDAKAIIAVGSCAAFGGIPQANPNPTGAVAVDKVITDKPIINISGCPPIPVVITGVIAHLVTFGTLPALDSLKRPKAFFGQTIHDRCYRRPFYDKGLFADTFDDEGAKQGWCLYKLGCKGPTTYNACATLKWNDGVSFPIESGHGCLGCSEPNFWDAGSFYKAVSVPTACLSKTVAYASIVGVGAGMAATVLNLNKKSQADMQREVVTIHDLTRENGKS